jgi:hypothetical protein
MITVMMHNEQGAYLGEVAGGDLEDISRQVEAEWNDPENINFSGPYVWHGDGLKDIGDIVETV